MFEEETVPVQEVPEQTRQLIESLTRRINEIQTLLRRLLAERLTETPEREDVVEFEEEESFEGGFFNLPQLDIPEEAPRFEAPRFDF